MLTVVFSDYKSHPGETRESTYPQFGMPSCRVEGERPRKMTLIGELGQKPEGAELEALRSWFFTKCLHSLDIGNMVVEIEAELPKGFEQWYLTADYYKEKE